MITVCILINGQPIYTRTAVNITDDSKDRTHKYKVDSGVVLSHVRAEGAVVLAKKMLDTIKEHTGI